MAWETTASASEFDAKSFTTAQIEGRSGQRSGAAGSYNGGGLFGIGAQEYSIVGMDVTQIPQVREAINTYVQGIEDHVNQIDTSVEANAAFRSEEVQKETKAYIDTVKEYCINLCSQLRAFSDKLASAQAAWEAGASGIAATVSAGNSAFSKGARYTSQL